MPTYLSNNELVAAIVRTSAETVLVRIMKSVGGSEPVFNVSKCGLGCSLVIDYRITDVDLHLASPQIVLDKFDLDTTLQFKLSLDFSALYDCLSSVIPLPPRCLTLCIPFTDICATKCLNLGSIGVGLPIPLSFALAGLYRPRAELVTHGDGITYWHVYPELDSVTPLVLDVGRIIQRICLAIANELPWPLSEAANDLCKVFSQVFDVIEDAINKFAVELTKLLFDKTGGWIGIQLKFIPIYKLRRDAVPGTSNPVIPAVVDALQANINISNELDVRFLLLSA